MAYLRQQRDGLRYAAYGLTEEQLRLKPTVSALSVGGLLKHVVQTEQEWLDVIEGHAAQDEEAYLDSFALAEDDTLNALTEAVAQTTARAEAMVASIADLNAPVTLPQAPWMPTGDGYTVRWVLLHILEELSRHAGHADIIREHIDGATEFELMAGAEGWPESDWIKPWRPPASGESASHESSSG